MMSLDKEPEPAPDGPARHASTSRSRLRYVIFPPVLALVALAGIIVYLVAGGQPRLASASTQAPSSSASAGIAPHSVRTTVIPRKGQKGRAALNSLHSNALHLPGQLTTSAKAWNAGPGGTALNAVSSELGVVTQAAGVRQYVTMKASCSILAARVRAAQAGPPIPDSAMQVLYTTALAKLASGASACQAAISQRADGDEFDVTTENQSELRRASLDFAAGAKGIYRATAEIQAVSGR
jgi:hypothetical protein